MLAELTYQDFEKYLNQPFLLRTGEHQIELSLVEVNFGIKAQRPGDRDSFSIVFKGPNEPVLQQQIYLLENEQLGELEIFLVSVGREGGQNMNPEKSLFYEAIFT